MSIRNHSFYLASKIGKFIGKIYKTNSSIYWNRFFNALYSGYKSTQFKKVGHNIFIQFPLYLLDGKNITIGNNCTILKGLRIETHPLFLGVPYKPQIIIGNNVSINMDCHIGCINKIFIADNVLIASKVFITDHFHGNAKDLSLPPYQRILESKGPVIIEENVWIGEGVVILPNVTIGKNCIIGANSVVTKSFPNDSIIAGNPAKLINKEEINNQSL